jgi:hypothetical protein
MQRPSMFIGSSSEGLRVAQLLQAELEPHVDATIWSQGVFGLSAGTLEALVDAAARFQFATLVLTPDDLVVKRDESGQAPRDNVLFEAGFFIGALGRRNTFLVSCRDDHLELPSDLQGITQAQYNRRDDLRAAIGPVATNVRAAIEAVQASVPLGPPDRSTSSSLAARPSELDQPTTATREAGLASVIGSVEALRDQFAKKTGTDFISTMEADMYNAVLGAVKKARPTNDIVQGLLMVTPLDRYSNLALTLRIMVSALLSAD